MKKSLFEPGLYGKLLDLSPGSVRLIILPVCCIFVPRHKHRWREETSIGLYSRYRVQMGRLPVYTVQVFQTI